MNSLTIINWVTEKLTDTVVDLTKLEYSQHLDRFRFSKSDVTL